MATINANSASTLATAVRKRERRGHDPPGLRGTTGSSSLSGRNFGSPMTIRSASGDGAVFSNLEI